MLSMKTGGFYASLDLPEANRENVHFSMLKLNLLHWNQVLSKKSSSLDWSISTFKLLSNKKNITVSSAIKVKFRPLLLQLVS